MFWRLTLEEIAAHPRAAADRLARRVVWYVWPPSSRPELAMWPLAAGARGRRVDVARADDVAPRGRFPTDSIVVLMGALGVETLLARLGARRGAVAALTLGIGFAAFVMLVRPLI